MKNKTPFSTTAKIALTAISMSLVCVATMIFSVSVPDTKGFFNIGETVIYVVAILLGPLIGALAGGVGAAAADFFLGFWHYVPATGPIKFFEGAVVGFLGHRRPQFESRQSWKAFTFGVGLTVGGLLALIGSIYYSGTVQLSLGIPPPQNPNVVFFVPPLFWYLLGALIALLITVSGFVWEPEFGWLIFSTTIGGAVMVAGYYLYQRFLLFPLFGIETIAVTEIPINVGQMLIGTIVAVPIVKILQRSFPQLKSQKTQQ